MIGIPVVCVIPPVYTAESRQTLGLLQQLQTTLSPSAVEAATLADIASTTEEISVALGALQIEFGQDALLEDVIQCLVVRQLAEQYARRKQRTVMA
jgi:hypothetical protein